jgi:hypothetical protein
MRERSKGRAERKEGESNVDTSGCSKRNRNSRRRYGTDVSRARAFSPIEIATIDLSREWVQIVYWIPLMSVKTVRDEKRESDENR